MQVIAVAVIWTVIFGVAYSFFKIQNAVMKGGIRPPEEEELAGMDLPEMGSLAYPEFAGTGATYADKHPIELGTATSQHEPVSEPQL